MKTNNQETIIKEAQAYLKRKNMSQGEFASKLGYSDAVISQLFKGEYTGNTALVLKKIEQEIGAASKWEIRKTTNFQNIQNLCLDAQEGQRMLLASGDTGSGKTSALLKYNNSTANSYYVLADVLMKPKDFLATIQKAIGVDEAGTMSQRLDSIVAKLESKEYPLLIIDDAGKLENHPKCFGLIQLLYDRLINRCGIVIAGTKRLNVYINKMASKDVMGFRELKRRITYWLPLMDGVEKRFIDAVCEANGITYPDAVAYLKQNCYNYGDVETIVRNYLRATSGKAVEGAEQMDVLNIIKVNKY